jgi:hypothetical protein
MRKLNEIFSKSTLKNMALKIVHYALVALVLAVCVAYLYWRWRRVNNQNKALEAELKLIQPYTNLDAAIAGNVTNRTEFKTDGIMANGQRYVHPEPLAAPAAAATPVVAVATGPPVLTPKATLAAVDESEDDEEPAVGAPPTLEAAPQVAQVVQQQQPTVVLDTSFNIPSAAYADLLTVMATIPVDSINETLAPGSITELPEEPVVDAPVAVAEPVPMDLKEEQPAPATTTRRRRK